jgi:hypothetical protein
MRESHTPGTPGSRRRGRGLTYSLWNGERERERERQREREVQRNNL